MQSTLTASVVKEKSVFFPILVFVVGDMLLIKDLITCSRKVPLPFFWHLSKTYAGAFGERRL